jgi:hypothetical protein
MSDVSKRIEGGSGNSDQRHAILKQGLEVRKK